jgi:hypothetical protein
MLLMENEIEIDEQIPLRAENVRMSDRQKLRAAALAVE